LSKNIKYIVPDWDDIVDPGYDFASETSSRQYRNNRFAYGVRLWEIFNPPPIDGVLISISNIINHKLKIIEALGNARKFLKLPLNLQLIGDCGAWQYRYMESPPYTVEYTLKTYEVLGVDYGVTLDHIPFFGNPTERISLSIENAIKSYQIWKPLYEKGDYRYVLMASVQGLEIEDYLRSFKVLYNVGFRHFAIGGLAKRETEFIRRLLEKLKQLLREYRDVIKIHMLGIARISVIPILEELLDYVEEVSFDNATFLRMSWTRTVGNYVLPDGRIYTSIRIREQDQQLLDKLLQYDNGAISFEEITSILGRRLSERGEIHYLPYYIATLRDKPWHECNCSLCKALGINIVIFRGNNRNRRRGFHNVYVFSKLLREGILKEVKFRIVKADVSAIHELGLSHIEDPLICNLTDIFKSAKKILIITNCTAEKAVNMSAVKSRLAKLNLPVPSFDLSRETIYRELLREFVKPAGEMYTGPTFRAVLKLVKTLRSCGKDVDIYIISARYGIINEKDPIIPYEATLKGMNARELKKWSEERGLTIKLQEIATRENYDLALIILPKEYAQTIVEFLEKNPILYSTIVTSRTILRRITSTTRGVLLPGGSIQQRMKYTKMLHEAASKICHSKLYAWMKSA
jgi:hypothetical protein